MAAAEPNVQMRAVMDGLMRKLAESFKVNGLEIDTASSLAAMGVDSLSAIELRKWLSRVVQANVTIFEILQAATLGEFARFVIERSSLLK